MNMRQTIIEQQVLIDRYRAMLDAVGLAVIKQSRELEALRARVAELDPPAFTTTARAGGSTVYARND